MDWPDTGIYLFFQHTETRDSTEKLRLTKIATHVVSEVSSTSLWNRLRNHRGTQHGLYEGGGNHRDSVFRKRVRGAAIACDDLHGKYPVGIESSPGRARRMSELDLRPTADEVQF